MVTACQEARRAFDEAAYNAAFEALYLAHSATVKGIARCITRTAEDAEEAANAAFSDLDHNIMIVDPARRGRKRPRG
jgi:hypothetical protein